MVPGVARQEVVQHCCCSQSNCCSMPPVAVLWRQLHFVQGVALDESMCEVGQVHFQRVNGLVCLHMRMVVGFYLVLLF